MTPAEERRTLEALLADVAVLKVGIQYSSEDRQRIRQEMQVIEQHGAEDRARIRNELQSIEQRILSRLGQIDTHLTGVDRECQDFRDSAAVEWRKYRDEISLLKSEIAALAGAVGSSEKVKDRRMTTTVAWIGGAFLLASGLVQTIATLAG